MQIFSFKNYKIFASKFIVFSILPFLIQLFLVNNYTKAQTNFTDHTDNTDNTDHNVLNLNTLNAIDQDYFDILDYANYSDYYSRNKLNTYHIYYTSAFLAPTSVLYLLASSISHSYILLSIVLTAGISYVLLASNSSKDKDLGVEYLKYLKSDQYFDDLWANAHKPPSSDGPEKKLAVSSDDSLDQKTKTANDKNQHQETKEAIKTKNKDLEKLAEKEIYFLEYLAVKNIHLYCLTEGIDPDKINEILKLHIVFKTFSDPENIINLSTFTISKLFVRIYELGYKIHELIKKTTDIKMIDPMLGIRIDRLMNEPNQSKLNQLISELVEKELKYLEMLADKNIQQFAIEQNIDLDLVSEIIKIRSTIETFSQPENIENLSVYTISQLFKKAYYLSKISYHLHDNQKAQVD